MKFEAIVGLGKPSAIQPCPSGTVCEKLHLKQDQRFDLTALIKTISPVREAGLERQCFDLQLIDGSTNEAKDKTQVMKITLFQSKQSHIEDECRSCMDQLADNTAADVRLQVRQRRILISIYLERVAHDAS